MKTICVLGGTGFVGYHLANHLTQAGYRIRVPSRRRERHRDLLVIPSIDVITADVHDQEALNALVRGCDAVVNLVAILNENRKGDFERVHVKLAKKVVAACNHSGVPRLLHMSALNADAVRGTSDYLRSKGVAEDYVHQQSGANLRVTSFRPSVIFGAGDHFLNRFASLLRNAPLFFPVACAQAKFAPVHVDDVVQVFVKALQDPGTAGQRYELCGPKTYTMYQLVDYVNRLIGTNRELIELGDGPSKLLASVMQKLPGKPFSTDNYLSTKMANVCREPCALLDQASPLDAIAPLYVGKRNQRGFYDQHRAFIPGS